MTLLLKNLLFTIVAPGTIGVYLPLLIAGTWPTATSWSFVLGIALFVVGGTIYVWCVWDFASFGQGTPAPIDAPRRLVVRGLYRYVRNPMYVGILSVIVGWAAMFQSFVLIQYGLLVALIFHLFVVFYEEPHLHKVFGDQYDIYCQDVNRWMPKSPVTSF